MEITLNTLTKRIVIKDNVPIEKFTEWMYKTFPDTWHEYTVFVKTEGCGCEEKIQDPLNIKK